MWTIDLHAQLTLLAFRSTLAASPRLTASPRLATGETLGETLAAGESSTAGQTLAAAGQTLTAIRREEGVELFRGHDRGWIMSYVTKPPVNTRFNTIDHISSICYFDKEEGQRRRRILDKEGRRAPLHSRNQHVQVGIQLDLLEEDDVFTSMVVIVTKH